MRIALVNNFPPYSGTGRLAYELHKHLESLFLKSGGGDQVDLFCTHVMKREELDYPENKKVKFLHAFPYKDHEKLSRFLIYFVDPYRLPGGYDLYHVTNHMLGRFAAVKKPSVVTVHDVLQFKYREKIGNFLESSVYNFFMETSIQSLKSANRLIAVSAWSASEVSKILKIPSEKVSVVYNGVDHHLFYPRDKSGSRKKLGLPLEARIILNVGSEIPRKNLAVLFESFKKILVKRPEALLVRRGEETPLSKKLIDKFGIRPRVLYWPQLRNEELPFLYSAADLLVIPSLEEGFGFPVIEAQACGLPVVASDRTSLPEVGGVACFYLHEIDQPERLTDLILSVFDCSEERLENLAKEGRENAGRFSWMKNAEQTIEVYKKVCDGEFSIGLDPKGFDPLGAGK